jgi:TRAP-type C4-dicarboxylate transport system permease small subunit
MNIPMIVALAAILFMAGCYALFLWASWQQYQKDAETRTSKINELLERLPGKTGEAATA